MLEELKKHNSLVQERIMKSFGYKNTDEFIQKSEDVNALIQKGEIDYDFELEKAVYADTAENRKLGRVGQEYHRGRKKSATVDDKSGGKVKKTDKNKTELKNGGVNDDLTKIWNKKKGVWEDSLAVYKPSEFDIICSLNRGEAETVVSAPNLEGI